MSDNTVMGIIHVNVPEYQIGQEVSVYFKDTMMVKGVCEQYMPEDSNDTNVYKVTSSHVNYGYSECNDSEQLEGQMSIYDFI